MTQAVSQFIHDWLIGLTRRPVLTALIVYSAAIVLAALLAIIAMWRAPEGTQLPGAAAPYVVQIPPVVATRKGRIAPV
jgi:hypothetical protein